MNVILLDKVENLGSIGDLVTVKAGYGRNYLLPSGKAALATKANLDGFWIQDRGGTTKPAFFLDDLSLKAVPPPATVNVTINADQVLRPIDVRHFGVNAAVWGAQFGTSTTVLPGSSRVKRAAVSRARMALCAPRTRSVGQRMART